MWITSKAWVSFVNSSKSASVPGRFPRSRSMMCGGPPTGRKATESSPNVRSLAPVRDTMSNRAGTDSNAARTVSGPMRTIRSSPTRQSASRKTRLAAGSRTRIPCSDSRSRARSWIEAIWSSENTVTGGIGFRSRRYFSVDRGVPRRRPASPLRPRRVGRPSAGRGEAMAGSYAGPQPTTSDSPPNPGCPAWPGPRVVRAGDIGHAKGHRPPCPTK